MFPQLQSRRAWRAIARSIAKRRNPSLEALEDRSLPATVTWINPLGGNWTDAKNWDARRVPNKADDAVIALDNVVVSFASASTLNVKSLTCSQTLKVSTGQLNLLQIIHAFAAVGRLFGPCQRRQQHAGQNGYDGDDYQKLD